MHLESTLVGPNILLPVTTIETLNGWNIEITRGTASSMHSREIPSKVKPSVWFHTLQSPALILGSTQKLSLINIEKAKQNGVEVCKRNSGGGIVSITPRYDCWIDILIPTTSPLWNKDVTQAFDWVGVLWKKTLAELLPKELARNLKIHTGQTLNHPTLGRLICFAGLSRGEITVNKSKIVGISQKRNRSGARFQCLFTPIFQPTNLQPFLRDDPGGTFDSLGIGLPKQTAEKDIPDQEKVFETLRRLLPKP